MKTLKDLEQMKTQNCLSFGTQYDSFIGRLEDCFVNKPDGLSQITSELSQWEDEAKKVIIPKLVEAICNNGTPGLDKDEITARLRWSSYNAE